MATTKGEMIKELKRFGIRIGDKGNATVKLEHLKYEDVCKLYNEFDKSFIGDTDFVGTGDSEVWKGKIPNETPFDD